MTRKIMDYSKAAKSTLKELGRDGAKVVAYLVTKLIRDSKLDTKAHWSEGNDSFCEITVSPDYDTQKFNYTFYIAFEFRNQNSKNFSVYVDSPKFGEHKVFTSKETQPFDAAAREIFKSVGNLWLDWQGKLDESSSTIKIKPLVAESGASAHYYSTLPTKSHSGVLTLYFKGKITLEKLLEYVEQFSLTIGTKQELQGFLKNKFVLELMSEYTGITEQQFIQKVKALLPHVD